ncbi:hypothetical protein [Hahella ganghwensis]|uniref:hypothetical protein n=1 Tax=Hahella ganghwensis TaxID=286420 RepID=UPI000363BB6B|nr:hypothetical protein [Hahella ganghwensis]
MNLDRSQIGRVVAFIRLGDVLKELTGSELPDPEAASDQTMLRWSTGEPPKDRPILAAFAPEYDILEWDEEFGWPDFITSLLGYLDISELLNCVAEVLPYREW